MGLSEASGKPFHLTPHLTSTSRPVWATGTGGRTAGAHNGQTRRRPKVASAAPDFVSGADGPARENRGTATDAAPLVPLLPPPLLWRLTLRCPTSRPRRKRSAPTNLPQRGRSASLAGRWGSGVTFWPCSSKACGRSYFGLPDLVDVLLGSAPSGRRLDQPRSG